MNYALAFTRSPTHATRRRGNADPVETACAAGQGETTEIVSAELGGYQTIGRVHSGTHHSQLWPCVVMYSWLCGIRCVNVGVLAHQCMQTLYCDVQGCVCVCVCVCARYQRYCGYCSVYLFLSLPRLVSLNQAHETNLLIHSTT